MKLQFRQQPFQAEAAKAVCDIFEGQEMATGEAKYRRDLGDEQQGSLAFDAEGWKNVRIKVPESVMLERIRKVQRAQGIRPSEKLEGDGLNLSVEMETGVGKTYTYIKTIYELYERYGWMKFIVVVPSVAIREGVYKSFQVTQEHFAGIYKRKINFFIYNSARLEEVDTFARDGGIQVMIINSQAFAVSFDAEKANAVRGGKEARTIFSRQDKFHGRKPIDVISHTNPIVIIDEPQSVEGKVTKTALKHFKPLFTLRYSATHKDVYNLVFRLDAVDAYRRKLVKKIVVKGVAQSTSTATEGFICLEGIETAPGKPPVARLRFDRKTGNGVKVSAAVKAGRDFDVFEQSGRLPEYDPKKVGAFIVEAMDARTGVLRFRNGIEIRVGHPIGNVNESMIRRIQIRETILAHLAKEERLFARGVKALSLFFIDEVAKYKQYADGNAANGEYADIFEEEYVQAVEDKLHRQLNLMRPDYRQYLERTLDDVHAVHAGYFSVDKQNHLVNPKTERVAKGRKEEATSSDVSAYDLIMKGKERLLSFAEPVRFIFSHSALREGWDNPNVFQICTLKQSTAAIRKRQEVGRGLRLCVNQRGERQDANVLADVFAVNELTVVASESYADFANGLQKELAESLGDRPTKVTPELFKGVEYETKSGAVADQPMSDDMAYRVFIALVQNGYIDKDGLPTETFNADKSNGTLDVGEDISSASLAKIIERVYNPGENAPANGDDVTDQHVNQGQLELAEFKELWTRINAKTAYTVHFDEKQLCDKCITTLNQKMTVPNVVITVTTGELKEDMSKDELAHGDAARETNVASHTVDATVGSGYRCDLLGRVAELTGLKRETIATILSGIHPQVFQLFRKNPEAFIFNSAKLIKGEVAAAIIEHITYDKIDDSYKMSIFTDPENLRHAYGDSFKYGPSEKGVYDLQVLDSDVEVKFAAELEHRQEVVVYTKLPKVFAISTPVGDYNPDWAIVTDALGKRHVYFVAETKGSLDSLDLRGIEDAKIACARKHFAAISGTNITYDVVRTYQDLLDIVTGKGC